VPFEAAEILDLERRGGEDRALEATCSLRHADKNSGRFPAEMLPITDRACKSPDAS